MLRNRLFNVLIAIAVVLVTALTVREAFATVIVSAQQDSNVECASLPSRYSIHSKFIKEIGLTVIYSEAGPVGMDGGMKELMSAYRNCPR